MSQAQKKKVSITFVLSINTLSTYIHSYHVSKAPAINKKYIIVRLVLSTFCHVSAH